MFISKVTIDGIYTENHEVIEILHTRESTSITCLNSFGDSNKILTQHSIPLSIGYTFEDAENYLQTLDDYMQTAEPSISIGELVWESGREYSSGEYVIYDSVVYTVLMSHTSQSDWTPDVSASLFAKALTKQGEILPWEQPDATNPYMKGDKVMFEGKTYESLIDNNVWSPEAYSAGWKEV